MPKIRSYAPSWLNKPAPGHQLFEQIAEEYKSPASIGKQIRWGDLVQLKESWEADQSRSRAGVRIKREDSATSFEIYDEEGNGYDNESGPEEYRIIKTPVADDIRQLIMSPNHDFLAVLTLHTVHICLLPDPSHLHAKDTAPFKPKFWTLGPTTHVTSRSAVVSAIWHPLGVNGSALVTVTEDAVVRVWELSTTDRWSFDAPSLAVDLKRLADGTSVDQDFSGSTAATSKAFSPDSFDMEVAAACFPARGSGGWSAMTLWIAMVGGDVYALCPLLPQRWSPPPTLIPSLSVSIVAKVAATEDDPMVSAEARMLAQQQLDWMSDLDNQEPKYLEGSFGETSSALYTRPSRPGIVPRLQGPFDLDFNPEDEQDDEVELKDIYVIGEKVNTSDLMMGEDDEELEMNELDREGLSLPVICLLSTSGQVKICLDIDGVEAKRFGLGSEPPSLLAIQTFDTVKPAELTPDSWPMFSEDITSRYSFYVTHSGGITHVNLGSWVFRLESELQGESEAGAEFRMDLLADGHGSERERIYVHPPGKGSLAAVVAMSDPDLGHLLLSATQNEPVSIWYDTPEESPAPVRQETTPALLLEQPEPRRPLTVIEPRPLFHPSEKLGQPSALPAWHDHVRKGRRRPLMQQEVRLSMATLEVFGEGHRLVSEEVNELNQAVAELFRKCEALQFELKEQITKANEVKTRIDKITGDDCPDDDEPVSDNMLLKSRLRSAESRQEELAKRMENFKRTLGKATSRELSDKEKAWMEEVRSMESSILGPSSSEEEGAGAGAGALESPSKGGKQAWKRFEEIKALKDALCAQAEQLQKRGGEDGSGEERVYNNNRSGSPMGAGLRIPTDIRKAKMAQVMGMLERETALVDAVKSRLERMSLG
ncbi:hypothetical protein B0T17DRAFT_617692 [Bombardia bombarda]|uniref:Uncharacterized protein n=1 Tax=Bombardia bombarda TaxID=252184 RepID=A0AA39WTB2_9PEZI|nr:hypothetical protein B0T17DRAFT_617692 [Bombardia bombarda]